MSTKSKPKKENSFFRNNSLKWVIFLFSFLVITMGSTKAQSPGSVSTSLKLWLKANTGVNVDASANVTSWTDKSATPSNATTITGTGTAPKLVTNTINNNAVVRFAGNGQALSGNFTSNVTGNYVQAFVVMKMNSINSATYARCFSIVGPTTAAYDYGNGTSWTSSDLFYRDNGTTTIKAQRNPVLGGGATFSVDTIRLLSSSWAPSAYYMYKNGAQAYTTSSTDNAFNSSFYTVGSGYEAAYSSFMSGDVAEIILYTATLSATDKNAVESYLATKYGITLDQLNPTNYVIDGTTAWNAATNAGYVNNITGIGQGTSATTGSAISQLKSKTINTDSIVTISTASLSNNSFFFIGDNGVTGTAATGGTATFPSIANRKWKIQVTGTAPTVTFTIDLNKANLTIPIGGYTTSSVSLLVSSSSTFTAATAIAPTSVVGGIATFTTTTSQVPTGSIFTIGLATGATTGFIYIHKKVLNEESAVDFTYNVTGGTTTIPSFILNDQPDVLNVSDLGASHGTVTSATSGGDGQLWAVAIAHGTPDASFATTSNPRQVDGSIYTRLPNTSTWQLCANQTAQSVDGAGLNAMVQANHAGDAYYYVFGGSGQKIYNASTNHSSVAVVDISNNGGGTTTTSLSTAIIDANGNIRMYKGTYADGSDTWTTIATSTSGNFAQRLDMLPAVSGATTRKIVYQKADGTVYILTTDGTSGGTSQVAITSPANSAAPSNTDVAYDDNGIIYAIFNDNTTGNDYVYDYDGTTWTLNSQSRSFNSITGGAGGQVWAEDRQNGAAQNTIYTRTTDGNRNWLNDERVRTTYKDNSEIFAVAPGTYTITESVGTPANWSLINITNYDPSSNSTSSLASKSATINVAAGEVVHAVFTSEFKKSTIVGNGCPTQFMQTFDSTSTTVTPYAQFHAPFPGTTSYHYSAATAPQDGLYTLETTTKDSTVGGSGWFQQSSFINADHTPHTGTNTRGYFMLANASYGKDEFYRQRVTGLIVGQQYVLGMWAADVSPDATIRPNVVFGIADTTSGATIGSINTGNISHAYWTQYSFTFTATTTTADIFFRNNNIGGNGNDIAIDDITLQFPPSSFVRNIVGSVSICSNKSANYNFVDSSVNGTWSISNNGLANITTTVNTTTTPSYSTATITPITGKTGTITLTYTIITGNCVSSITKDVIIANDCAGGTHTVSGTVFDDANGLNDNTVNGIPTNGIGTGNTLYVAAFNNTTGIFVGLTTVAADGTYSISGLADGANISLILTITNYTTSVTNGTMYATRPASLLPTAYGQTGENVGNTSGNDGSANGATTLGIMSNNIANINFGFDQKPIANTASITYASSSTSYAAPTLTGSDPEDGTYNGTSLTNTIRIDTLPTNGTLSYNGQAITVGQKIAAYNPALLKFVPTSGSLSTFFFSEIDSAGIASASPAKVTMNFPVVLPVVFGSFTAQPKECTVALSFDILSELNNDHFVIQYSSDGVTWKSLATLASKGASTYNYTDLLPPNGTGYYRIEQVDIDGNFSFSKTIAAYNNCSGKMTIAAYPNPVLNVVTLSGATVGSKLVLIDLTGKVLSQQVATGSGIDQVRMYNLAQGLYILKVTNTDGSSATIKLNKQ